MDYTAKPSNVKKKEMFCLNEVRSAATDGKKNQEFINVDQFQY